MILQDCVIPVNDQSQELKPHGNAAFPCAGYAPHYRQEDGDNVPWHWHDELEVIYIEKGQMTAKVPSQTFFPETRRHLGHQWQYPALRRSRPGMRPALLRLQPALVTGSGDSAMAEKYIRPLLTCLPFRPSTAIPISMIRWPDTSARPLRPWLKNPSALNLPSGKPSLKSASFCTAGYSLARPLRQFPAWTKSASKRC